MHDNEYKTKKNINQTKDKIELKHIYLTKIAARESSFNVCWTTNTIINIEHTKVLPPAMEVDPYYF